MAPEDEVYTRIGEQGFTRLVAAFYRRVLTDEVLGPMYPRHDLAGAEQRLRDFLVGRFGGPQRYIEQRGHPRLRMRHAAYAIDPDARDRWIACMRGALDALEPAPLLRAEVEDYFERAATAMLNRNPLIR